MTPSGKRLPVLVTAIAKASIALFLPEGISWFLSLDVGARSQRNELLSVRAAFGKRIPPQTSFAAGIVFPTGTMVSANSKTWDRAEEPKPRAENGRLIESLPMLNPSQSLAGAGGRKLAVEVSDRVRRAVMPHL
jgi:hypothetical protein